MPQPAKPSRRRGALTEEDRDTWSAFAHAVHPLPGKARIAAPPPAIPEPVPASVLAPIASPPAKARPLAPVAIGSAPGGLDRGTWERLRAGKRLVERTLDLHGRTAERAHHALRAFLHTAQAEHLRCVEVITGRGAGEAGGVLRRELPEWLNAPDLRPLILAVTHPHARNLGAVRILLRRRR